MPIMWAEKVAPTSLASSGEQSGNCLYIAMHPNPVCLVSIQHPALRPHSTTRSWWAEFNTRPSPSLMSFSAITAPPQLLTPPNGFIQASLTICHALESWQSKNVDIDAICPQKMCHQMLASKTTFSVTSTA